MSELVTSILFWVLIISLLSPIWLGLVWEIVEGFIRPQLIPLQDIERLAQELIRRCPEDALAAARQEEHAAWVSEREFRTGQMATCASLYPDLYAL